MNVSYFGKFIYFIIILYVGKLLFKGEAEQATDWLCYLYEYFCILFFVT